MSVSAANECEAYAELLSDLADGELEGPEVAKVEGHVAGRASCRVELKLLTGVIMSLTKVPEEDVPGVLAVRVMDQVRQPSLIDRVIAVLAAPFSTGFLKVSLSAAALVTIAFLGRTMWNEGHSPAAEQFASVPVWWGGNLLVNELPHPSVQSGKLGLRPGDALRTADKVEVTMQLHEAQLEIKPRSNVIISRYGLSLIEGSVVVRVDAAHRGLPRELAMKITTPNAIIVHTGTVYKVEVSKGITNTQVIEGSALVTSTSGASQELTAGQSAQVDANDGITPISTEPPAALRPPRTGPEEIRSISQSLPGGPAR